MRPDDDTSTLLDATSPEPERRLALRRLLHTTPEALPPLRAALQDTTTPPPPPLDAFRLLGHDARRLLAFTTPDAHTLRALSDSNIGPDRLASWLELAHDQHHLDPTHAAELLDAVAPHTADPRRCCTREVLGERARRVHLGMFERGAQRKSGADMRMPLLLHFDHAWPHLLHRALGYGPALDAHLRVLLRADALTHEELLSRLARSLDDTALPLDARIGAGYAWMHHAGDAARADPTAQRLRALLIQNTESACARDALFALFPRHTEALQGSVSLPAPHELDVVARASGGLQALSQKVGLHPLLHAITTPTPEASSALALVPHLFSWYPQAAALLEAPLHAQLRHPTLADAAIRAYTALLARWREGGWDLGLDATQRLDRVTLAVEAALLLDEPHIPRHLIDAAARLVSTAHLVPRLLEAQPAEPLSRIRALSHAHRLDPGCDALERACDIAHTLSGEAADALQSWLVEVAPARFRALAREGVIPAPRIPDIAELWYIPYVERGRPFGHEPHPMWLQRSTKMLEPKAIERCLLDSETPVGVLLGALTLAPRVAQREPEWRSRIEDAVDTHLDDSRHHAWIYWPEKGPPDPCYTQRLSVADVALEASMAIANGRQA